MNKKLLLFLFAVIFCGATRAQIITTIAGDSTGAYNGDNISAKTAKLHYPKSVAADAFGNVYIGDVGNSRIRKVSADGIITTYGGTGTAGYSGDGGPATAAQLNAAYLAVDNLGYLYLTDPLYNRVRVITPDGIIRCVAGTGAAGYSGDGGAATAAALSMPMGIAADDTGNIYVADNGNNCIRKITYRGIVTTVAGGGTVSPGDSGQATSALLIMPEHLTIDGANNLYVTSVYNVRKIDKSGIITTMPNPLKNLTTISGIAASASGTIYISGLNTYCVHQVNSDTVVNLVPATIITGVYRKQGYAGDNAPAKKALLKEPAGLAIDKQGNMFIADYGNHNVRRVSSVAVPGSVKEINADNTTLSVYPNPSTGQLTLSIAANSNEDVKVSVCNIYGQKVRDMVMKTNSPKDISLGRLPGIYIITAETSHAKWSKQIIIE